MSPRPASDTETATAKKRGKRASRLRAPLRVAGNQEPYMQKLAQSIAQAHFNQGDTAFVHVNKRGKPTLRLSKQACSIISDLMAKGFLDKIFKSANDLALCNQRNTLKPGDLLYGARVNVLDEELREELTDQCLRHVKNFEDSYAHEKAMAGAADDDDA